MPRHGGDSSSSAEDSGPEADSESEAESSSSSSCCLSEVPERTENGDAAETDSGGEDGDGREETGETKGATLRAPLVKSFSLPTPPPSLLPHKVVSILNLQVLSSSHHHDDDDDHDDEDTFYFIKRQKTEESDTAAGREGIDILPPPQPFQSQQTWLPWQQWSQPASQQHHQPPYQYHQQHQQHQQHQPPFFPPLSDQGQRLPPPLHTLPVFHPPAPHKPLQAPNPPQTHLHALTPQPCWCCYSAPFPYSPYWNHHSGGQSHRY